jgi:hypothetical protein
MARKTIKKATNPPRHQTRRYRRNTPPTPAVPPDAAAVPAVPVVENHHHRFVSSVTFDGKTLVTKSQKDNEPVNEKIYTIDQLGEELPLGRKLVEAYLDGNIPRGLQEHHRHTHMKPMFENVLVHPADLGLLAPKDDADDYAGIDRRLTQRALRRRRQPASRRLRLRLRPQRASASLRPSPRNLFDLP